jgi:hypothetical protein
VLGHLPPASRLSASSSKPAYRSSEGEDEGGGQRTPEGEGGEEGGVSDGGRAERQWVKGKGRWWDKGNMGPYCTDKRRGLGAEQGGGRTEDLVKQALTMLARAHELAPRNLGVGQELGDLLFTLGYEVYHPSPTFSHPPACLSLLHPPTPTPIHTRATG